MEIRRLSADERPKKMYTYKVTGTGQFPIDMLRYDCAWPKHESDARLFDTKYDNAEERRAVKVIELQSFHEPTRARWASFMWKVIE